MEVGTATLHLIPDLLNTNDLKVSGLIENSKVYQLKKGHLSSRYYTVPSDWSIYINYNSDGVSPRVGVLKGTIRIKTWVDEY